MASLVHHECPDWCHPCPSVASVELEIMPGCMGGVFGGLDECCCAHNTAPITVERLERMVGA